LRAAGSVMDNIAEGFDDGSTESSLDFWGMRRDHAVKFNPSYTGPWIQNTSLKINLIKCTR
jgi:hypothetical protein